LRSFEHLGGFTVLKDLVLRFQSMEGASMDKDTLVGGTLSLSLSLS